MSHHPSASATDDLPSTAKSSPSEDYIMIPSREVEAAEEELRLLHLSSEKKRKVAKVDKIRIEENEALRKELKELEGKRDVKKRNEELEKRCGELEEYKVESEKEQSRIDGVHEKEKEDRRMIIKAQDWRLKELNALVQSKNRKIEELGGEIRKLKKNVEGAYSRL
ncbi:hypothetical protein I302_100848 [Kwoniella bestiolae CBS 10118]|uniref:Uncharacterized protein n=1 Tax=Kwoniella bestiolae CBS 10118 TaxID=1296100 RepID=A0A1B9G679_9TREE|nr:hypothetical protein I302_04221 [Kwoniella bestiolae CBS 10118]OCF26535.1 hypothetical protein I302_04221 [Kwoniella bestiolae CBS 10118]